MRSAALTAQDAPGGWEDEPRDNTGKWTSGGGGSSSQKQKPGTAGSHVEGYSKHATWTEDGRIHTSNVDDAAKALANHQRVVLDQPRQVSTLIEKLGKIAKRCKDLGEKAPQFNLCDVSIPGTNLFCAESKGIPRPQMPQIKDMKDFGKFLEKRGYKVTKEKEDPAYLRATQTDLDGIKAARMMREYEKDPHQKRVIVSSDNYILDGHHHWAGALGADAEHNRIGGTKIRIMRINAPITTLLEESEKYGAPHSAATYDSADTAVVSMDTFDPNEPRDKSGQWTTGTGVLPSKPGTVPIPEGHVRLYHQTNEKNLESIRQHGIQLSKARGIEGPAAIYADTEGFYGNPEQVPSVEFHVPKEQWNAPFVKGDNVPPENIIGIHYPWHAHARYAESNPDVKKAILAGEHDDLLTDKDYGPAIAYIKRKYMDNGSDVTAKDFDPSEPRDKAGKWTSGASHAGEGTEFVSPNVQENEKFSEAIRNISSERMNKFVDASKDIDKFFHAPELSIEKGIGAWTDGAEETSVQRLDPSVDYDLGAVVTAAKGLIAHQKAALWFEPGQGDNNLYEFDAPDTDLQKLHTSLLHDGVHFHTLVPHDGKTTVYVYDEDGSGLDAVKSAAKTLGVSDVKRRQGRGEFIGSWDSREDGAKEYEQRIDKWIGSDSNRREGWRRLLLRWRLPGGETDQQAVNPQADAAMDTAVVSMDYDPSEPRKPAGSEGGGEWTSGGGGAEENTKAAEKKIPDAIVNVGGDPWNRETAKRLADEQATIHANLDKIVDDGIKNAEEVVPESWDELSNDQQDKVHEHWMSENFDDFKNSEADSWEQSEQPLEIATRDVAYDFNHTQKHDEWATEALDAFRSDWDDEENPHIPFSNEQLLGSIDIDENTGAISFDDARLDLLRPDTRQEGQWVLPGVELPKPHELLSDEMREAIIDALKSAFNDKVDEVKDDLNAFDYVDDDFVKKSMESYWDEKSDSQKFEAAKEILDELAEPGSENSGISGPIKLPKKWDPLDEHGGDDYTRTQRMARFIFDKRAKEVLESRDLTYDKEEVKHADNALWSAWKDSSTSRDGQLLQLAIADELGGRLNPKRLSYGRDALVSRADDSATYEPLGGYEAVKALVRAKWETTQYMLDKANVNDLELYRGISLQDGDLSDTTDERGYKALQKARIDRNGASSFTTDREIANEWAKNSPRKVTLRAVVPRTAVVSVPAYGINIHSEHEVVVAGTAWKGWDVWKGRAPAFEDVDCCERNDKGESVKSESNQSEKKAA